MLPFVNKEVIAYIIKQHKKELLKKSNVVGVAAGKKISNGKQVEHDGYALVVFVKEKLPVESLGKNDIIAETVGGIPTDIVEIGEVKALSTTGYYRPAPGGVSIGHWAITAGTLGAVVIDNITNLKMILSNNHVLANSNNANVGDVIYQPGPVDGGTSSKVIARLGRFVKIRFPGEGSDEESDCLVATVVLKISNFISNLLGRSTRLTAVVETTNNLMDAALAEPVNQSDLIQEQYNLGSIIGTAGTVPGDVVTKSGRTTDVTEGTVQYINATISVSYGNNRTATFDDQIVANHMSAGGDSGSVVCKVIDGSLYAVGLLFAGSETHTIMNDIGVVMHELEFRFT